MKYLVTLLALMLISGCKQEARYQLVTARTQSIHVDGNFPIEKIAELGFNGIIQETNYSVFKLDTFTGQTWIYNERSDAIGTNHNSFQGWKELE